jgi:hypothetical protein
MLSNNAALTRPNLSTLPAPPSGNPELLKSLVAIESSGGADHGLAVVSSTPDGTHYAVVATSLLSKNLYYFRLRSLYTGKTLKAVKAELSPDGAILRIKLERGDGLIPINQLADASRLDTAGTYLADSEMGIARIFKTNPRGTNTFPLGVSSGGPVFSENGELLGMASLVEESSPKARPGLLLATFSMDAKWEPVSYQKLANRINTLKKHAADTTALETLLGTFFAFDIIEIHPFHTPRYRKFIEEHDKLLIPTLTQNKQDNQYQFKVFCSYFSGLKSVRAWARSNLLLLAPKRWKRKYTGKWAQALRRRNELVESATEKLMDSLKKSHPAIKDKLL